MRTGIDPSLVNHCKVMEDDGHSFLATVRREMPYQIPTDYISWRFLSAAIALAGSGVKNRQELAKRGDVACWIHSHRTLLWFLKQAPLYCLSKEIIQAFDSTTVDNKQELLKSIKPALYTMLLLFPKGLIKTSEGCDFTFCTVHVSDINNKSKSVAFGHGFELDYLEHEHDLNIQFSTLDSGGNIFFTGFGLYPDGSIVYEERNDLGQDITTSQDEAFLSRMRSIILQTLLVLQFEPNILHMPPTSSYTRSGKGFGRLNFDTETCWRPRILKLDRPAKSSTTGGNGSHKSPRTHHRSGHWRCVDQESSKYTWVRPCLVNAANF